MDNPRPEKVAVVDEVREHLREADAAILTEYRGLKVKDLAQLRRSLSPTGTEYRIYKNTLVRFAARDLGLDHLEQLLEGPTAIAFVKGDAAGAAKAIRDFGRTNPALVIKGGVLGTKVMSADEAVALADLPSREVLLARLAGAIAAPMQQFAGLLQALPRNLAYGLKALIDQRVAGGEAAPAAAPAEAPEAAEDTAPTGDAPPAESVEAPEAAEPEAAEPEATEPEASAADEPAAAEAAGDTTAEADTPADTESTPSEDQTQE